MLFVAPAESGSQLAIRNLTLALERYTANAFSLEIVDVFTAASRALRNRVLVTPTLLAPQSARRVVGDLSEATLLDYFLDTLAPAAS
jgi:hypothetical protein